jgi:hypothetical protein
MPECQRNVKYVTTGESGEEVGTRNCGVGAHYDWNGVNVRGLVTIGRNTTESGEIAQASGGAQYQFPPNWTASAALRFESPGI